MQKGFFRKLQVAFSMLVFTSFIFTASVFAQVAPPVDITAGRAKLESDLAQLEAEIAAQDKILSQQQNQSDSLAREIAILNAQITKSKLSIKARDIAIANLVSDIGDKNVTIVKYSAKIDRERDSLVGLLRRTDELDSYSMPEVVLSDKPLSEFFSDLDAFQNIEDAIDESLSQVGIAKNETQNEKITLEDKKTKEQDLRYAQQVENKLLVTREADRTKLLKDSKGQEALYQKIIKDKQSRAAQIRAALFSLRDSKGIPFGTALTYANIASKGTNVRAALILAILTQESDLGKNVGSCLLSSLDSGDGVGKNSGTVFEQVMKAPRDTVPFGNITSRLGLDWKTTPVSCPPQAKYYSGRGFGGGMGPSQFIPSTWELFKSRVASVLGITSASANPWNAEHAFTATALYLKDLGAGNGGYTAERNSACKYYSGRSCDSRKPANSFYGDQVMATAAKIQSNIDFLNGNK